MNVEAIANVRRLFVDCDDTLILWDQAADETSGLYYGDRYRPNTSLIEAIEQFARMSPDTDIYVWSGGGVDYAGRWAGLFLQNISIKGWLSKNIRLPDSYDVCVDDMPIVTNGKTLSPSQFIDAVSLQLAIDEGVVF